MSDEETKAPEKPRMLVPRAYYKSPYDNGYLEIHMPELADLEELEMFEYTIALIVRQQRRRLETE